MCLFNDDHLEEIMQGEEQVLGEEQENEQEVDGLPRRGDPAELQPVPLPVATQKRNYIAQLLAQEL